MAESTQKEKKKLVQVVNPKPASQERGICRKAVLNRPEYAVTEISIAYLDLKADFK